MGIERHCQQIVISEALQYIDQRSKTVHLRQKSKVAI